MGGQITVDSIYTKGTTFVVTLKQGIVDGEAIGELDLIGRRRGSSKSHRDSFKAPDAYVLIVDDNELNLKVARKLLLGTEAHVDTATGGKAALAATMKTRYHIIFMDHMMPEMDGIEVFNRLKSDTNNINNNTPVIMLTANAMMGADQKYLENGFNDYLSKPIKPLELEKIVLKHLPDELINMNTATITTSTSHNEDEQAAVSCTFIDALNFLDTASGLEFAAGDEDFYRQILTTFVNEDKRPALNDLLSNEDWQNYQIVAHSLKGTALTIGAPNLSSSAKELEFAVKENRIDYIREHHDEVMEQYGKLLEKLKLALQNN